MARQKKGILDGFRGSIGSITGTSVFGQEIIKKKRKASTTEPTPAQLIERQRMRTAQTLFTGMSDPLFINAWSKVDTSVLAHNNFFRANRTIPINIFGNFYRNLLPIQTPQNRYIDFIGTNAKGDVTWQSRKNPQTFSIMPASNDIVVSGVILWDRPEVLLWPNSYKRTWGIWTNQNFRFFVKPNERYGLFWFIFKANGEPLSRSMVRGFIAPM